MIYTIGETVYDIIFKNNIPIDAKAGGAMLNTSVSLGRLNIPVALIGDYANDKVGEIIESFLIENGVNTQYITKYPVGKTRLALAFLDDENNAEYSFYKLAINDNCKLSFPKVTKNDYILFGSFYAIKKEIRNELFEFLSHAKNNGAIIIYDPNFRTSHLDILEEVIPMIQENIAISNIVKGSDEDFLNIFQLTNENEIYNKIKDFGCENLILTKNKLGVSLFTPALQKNFKTPAIIPISTIGAG
ncbi:MAG: carbohydrate kinase, partial [Bacteroidetes bacterium]|nr:carbohydrate kinase [Bacteroidota bacterium]